MGVCASSRRCGLGGQPAAQTPPNAQPVSLAAQPNLETTQIREPCGREFIAHKAEEGSTAARKSPDVQPVSLVAQPNLETTQIRGPYGRKFDMKMNAPTSSSPRILFFTDDDIHDAVKKWCDPTTHEEACSDFGHISSWDVRRVTNMRDLFKGQAAFNNDISQWDTSNVISMHSLFRGASKFNQPVGAWDVSSVTTMSYMFASASVFNQPLNAWNTSCVTDMSNMFRNARLFKQPLAHWEMNVVTSTGKNHMFWGATAFLNTTEHSLTLAAWGAS